MKVRICIFLALIVGISGLDTSTGSSVTTSTPVPTTSTTPAPTTSTTPAPTATSTPAPTTTSTPAPSTASSGSDTTASGSTGTPTSGGTGTPTPSTTPKGSTTPAPTPITPPTPTFDLAAVSFGIHHQANDTSTNYCTRVDVKLTIEITYTTTETKNVTAKIFLTSTNATQPDQRCSNGTEPQPLSIEWTQYNSTFNLTFWFEKTDDGKSYSLHNLDLEFLMGELQFPDNTALSPDVNVNISTDYIGDMNQYTISNPQSYRCDVSEEVNLNVTSVEPTYGIQSATIIMEEFRFYAYQDEKVESTDWPTEHECSDDFTTSDIVPIAVGCALAALVVIVLIAYLIGRRRSRQKGYQSV